MAEPLENDAKRRFDPIMTIGACFFVLAVALAAMPAFKAGPSTIAGLLLLAGLAGVAFLGLIAFRGASRTASVIGDTDFAAFAASLTEPAAICAADGLILSANGPWREVVGLGRRLPKNGGGLFAALSSARRGVPGQGRIRCGKADRMLAVTALWADHFLLPISSPATPAPVASTPPTPTSAGRPTPSPPGPFPP